VTNARDFTLVICQRYAAGMHRAAVKVAIEPEVFFLG
jgi:hypothetical protein